MSSLQFVNGVLVLRTPYNRTLVDSLKGNIPASERRWNGDAKVWEVDPKHAPLLVHIVAQYCGETLAPPVATGAPAATETRILEVRYIGLTKDRGGNDSSAFGWAGGEWSVVFPETVLRAWFNADAQPSEGSTLYATLGIPKSADLPMIKSAYRRLALAWHPDRCKEPGAKEQFLRIQFAWETLSNGAKRAKYDAGLQLTSHSRAGRVEPGQLPDPRGYRSPLRCGYVVAEGIERLGRFVVSKITGWEDITRSDGRVLSTFWPMGADKFVEMWL